MPRKPSTVPTNHRHLFPFYWARLVAIDGHKHAGLLNYNTKITQRLRPEHEPLQHHHKRTHNTFFIKADPPETSGPTAASILSKYAPDGTSLFPPGGINTSLLASPAPTQVSTSIRTGTSGSVPARSTGPPAPAASMVPCFAKFSNLGYRSSLRPDLFLQRDCQARR